MKNFDLNGENVLLLSWNFVFTLTYDLQYFLWVLLILVMKICSGEGCQYFAGLTEYSGAAHVWFSFINLSLIYAFII